MAENPEHVQAILKASGGEREEYAPPLTEWTAQNEQLARMTELLETLIGVQIARGGGKPRPPKPSPRPRTAFDQARKNLAIDEHRRMVDRVLHKRRTVD